eukprot:gnl/TRDRNA2_/TRDRNA2_34353_c0_seq1.p1 gnl/TRDRNA2_/TRDRNA2_34353_c0~~gnl/TRDRNA2_/TRDRNA2_34353_c0_seq1.p1  ORF type:complete len:462 (-),score=47.55 gnl/TRDRNA2_/TRDRNA2_34353_c0_seq1:115-1302(-)
MCYAEVAAAVEWFAEAMLLKDSDTFFWDILANNQHKPHLGEDMHRYLKPAEGKHLVMQECRCLLSCMHDPAHAQRAEAKRVFRWFNFEAAMRKGANVYLGCETGVIACTSPFTNGAKWVFGIFDPQISDALFDVTLESLEGYDPADVVAIRKYIRRGADEPTEVDIRFEHRLRRIAAGPRLLAEAAADKPDISKVWKVCGTPGLSVNSDTLKGSLGETALHVAAAHGSEPVISSLLQAQMDPNIRDSMHECPLHYAVLGGQAGALRMLLLARADPCCESAFGETPLDVALQSPAGFLDIKTEGLAAMLRSSFTSHTQCEQRYRNNEVKKQVISFLQRTRDLPEGLSHERFREVMMNIGLLEPEKIEAVIKLNSTHGDGSVDVDQLIAFIYGDAVC